MLLEMEQHSGLMSLNMSPFHLSPQGSPQSAASAGQPQQQQQQQQQQQPQAQYGSSPYGNCAQSPPSAMCHHHQQHQQHQQQPQQTQSHSQSQSQQLQSSHNQAQSQGGGISGFESAFFYATALEERCPMCGDKMSGYQYGLLTCESCKGAGSSNGAGAGGNGNGNANGNSNNNNAPSSGTSSTLEGSAASGGGGAGGGGGYGSSAATSAGNGGGGNGPGSTGPGPTAGNATTGTQATSGNVAVHTGTLCHGLGQVGVGVVTGSIPCPSDFPDTKDIVIEELCPVCGDKVSGYHYGLLTCESCKGFFKRTVQNKKVYTCVAERSCHIDKTQRKRCPYCRFQKCLEVGMKLEAVREDRMRGGRNKFGPMYKRDRARKLQMMRQRQLALQTICGSLGDPSNYTSTVTSFLHIKQEIQIPQQNLAAGNHLHNLNPGLDSKLWPANSTTPSPKAFNFGEQSAQPHGPPAASAPSTAPLKTSPLIRDFVQTVDDREWQASLFGLLQNQTYNQCEVDLFELMCKVLDQNLFSQVDWARNSVFFKDLKVDDQMKLLQHSWSDMLVLDHLHQRLHNNLPDETTLHNGQKFDLLCLGLLGVPSLADLFNDLSSKLQELKFDLSDYICMKFLMLLNHDVRGLVNKKHVQEGHEQVQQALLDYTLTCYPSIPDKFNKLLAVLPEIHVVASRGEDHLYQKHCNGGAPTQTLLMEMLHAKRK
ncbi:hypothetical protein KPH14_007971 [Odynerus spinipes]|uniref:Nuclear hormone receptor FTZ-F1 n=1 Tax=Odynerus spinipes TaxID=1348599 RepID=A0AAD9VNR9_9HYME|nr:hypothetical protein KPH14_007971 [Odynerus spinipes]